ncbi:hypothetical protein NUW58_g8608 [Xylaria curta]|uniref:Uncharacterized protein n=1 Tax=Xylaria curta TaxID=42375 RepID=A0ACC1N5N8_9PEZI|nr:hypothetical protein NUW58_g8608 [Xylaria curta]
MRTCRLQYLRSAQGLSGAVQPWLTTYVMRPDFAFLSALDGASKGEGANSLKNIADRGRATGKGPPRVRWITMCRLGSLATLQHRPSPILQMVIHPAASTPAGYSARRPFAQFAHGHRAAQTCTVASRAGKTAGANPRGIPTLQEIPPIAHIPRDQSGRLKMKMLAETGFALHRLSS